MNTVLRYAIMLLTSAVMVGCDLLAIPLAPSVPETQYVRIPVKSASAWRYDGRLLHITVQPDYDRVEQVTRLKILGGEGIIEGDRLILSCTGVYSRSDEPKPTDVELPAFYLPAGSYQVQADGRPLGHLDTADGEGRLTVR